MPAPASTLTTGLNSYYLIQLIENLAQLSIGYNPNSDDIDQDLVLQFISEGYNRIVSLDDRWPWFQSSYQTQVVEDQRIVDSNFVLTGTFSQFITVPQANIPLSSIRQVINVTAVQGESMTGGLGMELVYIDQFKAESIWIGTTDQPNIPGYWSLWNNSIQLWPRANQTYTLTIRGYRQPNLVWLTDSNNSESTNYVDLDQELHIMLINFVLARIFQYQEDPEMAAVYMNHYNTGVQIAKENITGPNSNQPLIMSGGLQLNGAANRAYGFGNFGAGIQVLPGSPSPLGRMF